ncbi:MAG: Phosphate transporter family protein [Methanomassiliicoccales archaeon PtaU1.Bin124]|nr:MAG: Phosphate transporter family protein [Methanomassiliicoccales archaeon PtaU1.Bin124]
MDIFVLILAYLGVAIAFGLAFTNGFQDAATTAATIVASRSATPRQAIVLISVMNGIGAIVGGSAVAFTIAELVRGSDGTATVVIMLSAMTGAVAWNLITWYYGIPSSSTYALIGGIIGAGIAVAGVGSISWGTSEFINAFQLVGVTKVVIFLIVSILFGLIGGYLVYKLSKILLRNAKRSINRTLQRTQWVAASIFALANGANDSQKQMGMIALIILSTGMTTTLDIPVWVRLGVAAAIAFGTLAGGWRVMRTVGSHLFEIKPIHSVDSQIVSGAAILISTFEGAPISSTQVVSTSILGIGAADNAKKVRWSKGIELLSTWTITLPAVALIAGTVAFILSQLV